MEEWLSLFDDPILGNSAVDRLSNASYQIAIEGNSYREKLSPHRKLLSDKERAKERAKAEALARIISRRGSAKVTFSLFT